MNSWDRLSWTGGFVVFSAVEVAVSQSDCWDILGGGTWYDAVATRTLTWLKSLMAWENQKKDVKKKKRMATSWWWDRGNIRHVVVIIQGCDKVANNTRSSCFFFTDFNGKRDIHLQQASGDGCTSRRSCARLLIDSWGCRQKGNQANWKGGRGGSKHSRLHDPIAEGLDSENRLFLLNEIFDPQTPCLSCNANNCAIWLEFHQGIECHVVQCQKQNRCDFLRLQRRGELHRWKAGGVETEIRWLWCKNLSQQSQSFPCLPIN